MLSIALPQMQGSLSATQDQIAWVLTSYLIAVAVSTPLWGALGQTFGSKPLLLISITGFMVFLIFAGMSTTLEEILVYRFIQGVFGASLMPLALSSLLANYPREDISIAMGWWGIGVMFGPVFGPTIGGYITEYYSWRWAFYINIPICVTAFTMIAILVPHPRNRQSRTLNYFGFVLLAITVGTIQFVLDRGQRFDWFASPTIIALCLISAAALWMFVINSLTTKTPFLDPAIFADKNYMSGIVLRVLFGLMLFSSLVLLPPFLQNQGGYTLLDSGILMAPRGFGSMCAAMFVGRMIKIVDPRKVIMGGMLLTSYMIWELSLYERHRSDADFDRQFCARCCICLLCHSGQHYYVFNVGRRAARCWHIVFRAFEQYRSQHRCCNSGWLPGKSDTGITGDLERWNFTIQRLRSPFRSPFICRLHQPARIGGAQSYGRQAGRTDSLHQ